MRTIAWNLAILALLSIGALGVYNGLTEWPDTATGQHRSITAGRAGGADGDPATRAA